jgi:PAS domain S-box-containing protein
MKTAGNRAEPASEEVARLAEIKDKSIADISAEVWAGQEVLAVIVDSSDDAVLSTDLDGIIRTWNRGAQQIFGYTVDEAIGHSVSMLAAPGGLKEMPVILERICRGERVEHYETKRLTKDGRVLDMLLTASPIRDGSGAIIGASRVVRDITGQKRAEELQERLAAIVESSDDAIISKDLNGMIQSWNRGAQRIFGYSAEEVIGRPVSILAAPERAEEMPKILERIRRGEPVDHYETKRQTKDGRILDISLTVSPIRDASGVIIGASKVARDITEQKRGLEFQERLAAIVESSDDAIISKDLSGIIQSWNRGAQRIFGYTAEEVIGRPVTLLAVPERIEEIPNILERIRRGERVDHYQTKRRTKDGRVLDISLTVSPIRDRFGTIVGASKVARDITEQKRGEREREALLLREKAMRETAELLNQVGPALVSELDLQRLTHKITDIATRLTGAQFGALIRNPMDAEPGRYTAYALSGIEPEAFDRFPVPHSTQLFGRTLRGEGPVRADDILEDSSFEVNPESGRSQPPLPFRSYLAVPVISRSGELLAGLFFGHADPALFTEWHERVAAGVAAQAAIALDNARLFSELTNSREAAERSNEELRRANSDLEQFAFSASHDLKEPLRMVAIYSQIVQRKFSDALPGEAQDYLDKVVAGARRMDDLVQDLLAYTRSAAMPTSEEVLTPVSADAALDRALTNLTRMIEDNEARIERGPLPSLSMTELHLTQLFQNLVENAIKYRRSEPPRVRIEAAREADLWRICVHDNGIGIGPEYREQVFGLFKRLHSAEKYSGTGIGLAICQRIVHRYGGRIWVESGGEGQGATFCFTVPGGTGA